MANEVMRLNYKIMNATEDEKSREDLKDKYVIKLENGETKEFHFPPSLGGKYMNLIVTEPEG